MIQSVAQNRTTWWRADSAAMSSTTRAASFARNGISSSLIPQNTQWLFWPHQQPRALSNGRFSTLKTTPALAATRSDSRKKSS